MTYKQACVLIVGDEPDILHLKQLIAGRWGAPAAVTGSEDAAPWVQAEIDPLALTLDTGPAGQSLGKALEMPPVLVGGKGQNCETDASAKETSGESQLGRAPAEVVFLGGELRPDLGHRRIPVAGRDMSPSDMGAHSSYCTACGSGSIGLQGKKSGETEYEQCLGGTVVLHLNLSRIGQRLGGIGSGLWGLLISSGIGLRHLAAELWDFKNSAAVRSWWISLRKLTRRGKAAGSAWIPKLGRGTNFLGRRITRHSLLPVSRALRIKLEACLQFCRNRKELYFNGRFARKASTGNDIEQTSQTNLDGGIPGAAPPPAGHLGPAGTAPVHPSTLNEPRLDELLVTQGRFIGSKLEAFLQALLEAYSKVAARGGNDPLLLAPVVPLADVYESLHWSPNQPQAYSRNEFARDIYLLHRSGLDKTASGVQVSFPISRGVPEKTFTTTDENGVEKRYFGIRFMKVAGSLGRHTPGLAPQNLPV